MEKVRTEVGGGSYRGSALGRVIEREGVKEVVEIL